MHSFDPPQMLEKLLGAAYRDDYGTINDFLPRDRDLNVFSAYLLMLIRFNMQEKLETSLKLPNLDTTSAVFNNALNGLMSEAVYRGKKDVVDLLLQYSSNPKDCATQALQEIFNTSGPHAIPELVTVMVKHLMTKGADINAATAAREEMLKEELRAVGRQMTTLRAYKREIADTRCATVKPATPCPACKCGK